MKTEPLEVEVVVQAKCPYCSSIMFADTTAGEYVCLSERTLSCGKQAWKMPRMILELAEPKKGS